MIDNSSYSIEWELFDSRATDPCFEVSGNKLRLNSSVGSWNVNTVFCNTLMQEIIIKKQYMLIILLK